MSKFWKKIFTSKYTGKQIDEAVGKVLDGDVGMTNPMTAAGDLIVGGEDGAAAKLTKGTDGKVLKMVSGAPAWADDSAGGMENPMTTAGDMIIGGADGAATRLPKGTDGQVLSVVSGAPAWAAAGGGGGAEHLYWHTLTLQASGGTLKYGICVVISTSANLPTVADLKTILNNGGQIAILQGGGYDIANDKLAQPLFLVANSTAPENQCTMYYFWTDDNTFSFKSSTEYFSNITVMPTLSKTDQIY